MKLLFRIFVLLLSFQACGIEASSNERIKTLMGEPAIDYTKIDILYVKLIKSALSSLKKKGFELDLYESILVAKDGPRYYSVTFRLKNFTGYGGSEEFPSWEVLIDGETFKVVHARFPP